MNPREANRAAFDEAHDGVGENDEQVLWRAVQWVAARTDANGHNRTLLMHHLREEETAFDVEATQQATAIAGNKKPLTRRVLEPLERSDVLRVIQRSSSRQRAAAAPKTTTTSRHLNRMMRSGRSNKRHAGAM